MAALLTDNGMSVGEAAGAVALAGIGVLVGRVLSGYALDHLWSPIVACLTCLAPVLGTESTLIAVLVTRYLGMKEFGAIYGIFYGIVALGFGIGPAVYAAAFDAAGSYTPALIGFSIALVLAGLLFFTLGQHRYEVEEKDEPVQPLTAEQAGEAQVSATHRLILSNQPDLDRVFRLASC